MNPTVAGLLVAVFGLLVTIGAVIWRDGRRDGRIDTVLEQLTKIAVDHEDRIRSVEGRKTGGHRRIS